MTSRSATERELSFGNGRFILTPRRIGGGSFGDIFECYDRRTGRTLAVKLENKMHSAAQLPAECKVYSILHTPELTTEELERAAACLYLADHDSPESHSSAADKNNNNSILSNGTNDDKNTPNPIISRGNSDSKELHSNNTGNRATSRRTNTWIEKDARISKALKEAIPDMHKHNVVGVPWIYYYGTQTKYNIIVMDMCGPSLEELFNYCHRRFSLKTVLMLADQIIHRIQFFHDKGFIHRDIKTDNFVTGIDLQGHIIYLIDFGLSKMYWNVKRNVHIPFVKGKSLTGTARYCSINAHRGCEQSRRDDLEAIGFMLIYFLKGELPWQGLHHRDQTKRVVAIGETKMATSLESLCEGLPEEFMMYMEYCRSLNFQERPNYTHLRRMFRSLGQRMGYSARLASTQRRSSSSSSNSRDGNNSNKHGAVCYCGGTSRMASSSTPLSSAQKGRARSSSQNCSHLGAVGNGLSKHSLASGPIGNPLSPKTAAVHPHAHREAAATTNTATAVTNGPDSGAFDVLMLPAEQDSLSNKNSYFLGKGWASNSARTKGDGGGLSTDIIDPGSRGVISMSIARANNSHYQVMTDNLYSVSPSASLLQCPCQRSLAATVLSDCANASAVNEIDTGFYDWKFDWFVKREREVSEQSK